MDTKFWACSFLGASQCLYPERQNQTNKQCSSRREREYLNPLFVYYNTTTTIGRELFFPWSWWSFWCSQIFRKTHLSHVRLRDYMERQPCELRKENCELGVWSLGLRKRTSGILWKGESKKEKRLFFMCGWEDETRTIAQPMKTATAHQADKILTKNLLHIQRMDDECSSWMNICAHRTHM